MNNKVIVESPSGIKAVIELVESTFKPRYSVVFNSQYISEYSSNKFNIKDRIERIN